MGAERLHAIIKQIVKEYIDNENMSDLVYGTYQGGSLKLDSKPQAIPMDMVDVPLALTEYTVAAVIGGVEQEITIKNKLSPGERVCVVQQRGSQRYSIIDRV